MKPKDFRRDIRLGVALLFIGLFATSWDFKSSALESNAGGQQQQQQPSPDAPIDQTRKNIQVLKGLPERELFPLMNFVATSLDVKCDYCHVTNGKNPKTGEDNWIWESDDKPKKLVGRRMMKMVLEINRPNFDRYLLTLTSPQGVRTAVINGEVGWVGRGIGARKLGGRDLEIVRRMAESYALIKVMGQPEKMKVLGTEKIGDREAYVVALVVDSDTTKRFFFDTQAPPAPVDHDANDASPSA